MRPSVGCNRGVGSMKASYDSYTLELISSTTIVVARVRFTGEAKGAGVSFATYWSGTDLELCPISKVLGVIFSANSRAQRLAATYPNPKGLSVVVTSTGAAWPCLAESFKPCLNVLYKRSLVVPLILLPYRRGRRIGASDDDGVLDNGVMEFDGAVECNEVILVSNGSEASNSSSLRGETGVGVGCVKLGRENKCESSRVRNWYQSQGYREPAVMSSASSAVTYTSVYTDSEPGRVFWGADEEISDGGSPRVIVLGYDGLPIQPVAPPSPDYIPGPEEPQTPPDEHEFPAEEQPLPPVVSPTAKSLGYVVESDPKENPEEYKDDETEDGPVDYPMDRGDDGDDDDGDLSGDDADDEDEDERDEDDKDEEEEEEHLALADSAVIVPTVELVSPPEGTKPVIPPPSTDITTTGARITVRLQASISLPPEAKVERLLAMPTPSPSPPILLSPPSAGERLARCMAPHALSSPL
ncbi:hypothetical protein Tco_0815912 [Tanacetum coccineum]